jgi:hypothetical protein
MPVAPVIARTKGRRRAGQGRDSIVEFGAAKRTLDAPEPSRRIRRRSDGHEHRVVLQILSRHVSRNSRRTSDRAGSSMGSCCCSIPRSSACAPAWSITPAATTRPSPGCAGNCCGLSGAPTSDSPGPSARVKAALHASALRGLDTRGRSRDWPISEKKWRAWWAANANEVRVHSPDDDCADVSTLPHMW